jgi:hypothetical protein
MKRKVLDQQIGKALRLLREVEQRPWYSILLDGNVTDERGEAQKLIDLAACYQQFLRQYPYCSLGEKAEAYAILKAGFANALFPSRKHLSRDQFGLLLDLHLETMRGL